MYERAFINVERRALHEIPDARHAIVREARSTLERVRSCKRMAPVQRSGFVDEIESLITRATNDPDAAARLDRLDTEARKVLKHLAG